MKEEEEEEEVRWRVARGRWWEHWEDLEVQTLARLAAPGSRLGWHVTLGPKNSNRAQLGNARLSNSQITSGVAYLPFLIVPHR